MTSDLDCGLFLHEFLVLYGYLGSLVCYKLHSRCVFDGDNMIIKVVKYIEMPKACLKKSMCHFQKLETILK